ncbi:MAG TPA: molybdopterin-binding protein [Syntrophales bacterium]|nr:molybdopterin-binding protein [Syntrophales bacterium]
MECPGGQEHKLRQKHVRDHAQWQAGSAFRNYVNMGETAHCRPVSHALIVILLTRERFFFYNLFKEKGRRRLMKISARNALKGTVKKIKEGVVNDEIIFQLAGGDEIVSIITQSSSSTLGLKVGKPVIAVIKASNVMVAVED